MKRFLSGMAVVVGTLGVSGAAVAQEVAVSGNVAIASDYAFRGVSQTLEKPAVQGGLDLEGALGLYAGVWGSSVNFGEDLSGGERAQMELDMYGGIAPTLGGFDLGLGLIYYAYPGAASVREYNFFEAVASAGRSFGRVSTGINAAYSPNFFAASGAGLFTGVDLSGALPGTPLTLIGGVGRQAIENNDAFGAPDYTAWSAGIAADVLGSTIGATLTGTDISAGECFGGSDLCRTRVIVGISRGL